VPPSNRESLRSGGPSVESKTQRRTNSEASSRYYDYNTAIGGLGELTKKSYQIAQDFRLPARRANGRIAGLCNPLRNTVGGRKDEQAGSFLDRNRLSPLPEPRHLGFELLPQGAGHHAAVPADQLTRVAQCIEDGEHAPAPCVVAKAAVAADDLDELLQRPLVVAAL
jgi:hypothetical protein